MIQRLLDRFRREPEPEPLTDEDRVAAMPEYMRKVSRTQERDLPTKDILRQEFLSGKHDDFAREVRDGNR